MVRGCSCILLCASRACCHWSVDGVSCVHRISCLQVKCEEYWPNIGQQEYGDVVVTHYSTQKMPDFLIRCFKLKQVGHNRSGILSQWIRTPKEVMQLILGVTML